MRYSDRPIEKPSDDLLGRAAFAMTLARSIDQLSIARDGFVMAVLGQWGSGKTSVVELVCRYLQHIEMARESALSRTAGVEVQVRTIDQLELMAESYDTVRPIVQKFSDEGADVSMWQAAHQRQMFALQLETEKALDDAILYWKLLRRVEKFPRTTVVRFSPWLISGKAELSTALLGELARALGPKLGTGVREAFADLLKRLSELGPMASGALGLAVGAPFGVLAKAGFDFSGLAAKRLSDGPTLEELRLALRKALLGLGDQQILILVDDLDRLTPPETLAMVSLIKSLGDLPNTVYLLTYDEAQIERNLRNADVDGLRFLEKIVQYSVWVPPPPAGSMLDLLNSDLKTILGDVSAADASRLGTIWQYVLRHYIRNPRDARRLANALAVPASGLRDNTDVPDLVLLEAIRIFEPIVYSALRSDIDEFVGQ